MKCANCQTNIPSDAEFCPSCGYDNRVKLSPPRVYNQPQKGGFFSFEKMITPSIIKFIFIIGLIIVILFGLMGISSSDSPVFSLLITAFSLIMWRVYCELMIVLFKIHENLVQIKNQR